MAAKRETRRTAAPAANGTTPFLSSRVAVVVAAVVIAVAAALSYWPSLNAPFVFDDLAAIENNLTLREPWSLRSALFPPIGGGGVVGRPLVNLSLAANYGWGGLKVRGYHVFNLTVHILAALALLGLIRRTLQRPKLAGRFGAAALPLSFTIALLWAVHPLQTESVICVVQRNELLVGLFYLLTLYALVRSADSLHPRRWESMAVLACLLGVVSKEVIVSAPLVALLYDRTFIAGSFRAAWPQRTGLYAGFVGCWIALAILMSTTAQRNGTVGFGLGVTSWEYALTQCHALVRYLRLAVWPTPLVLDYGTAVVRSPTDVIPELLVTLALLAGAVVAWIRRPALGFLGACPFLILAPSSSIVPLVSQTLAEHRMYLPLASVLTLGVLGLYLAFGRRMIPLTIALAIGLGVVTWRRAEVYQTAESIWTDTVEKMPDNPRAQLNLGNALTRAGHFETARPHYEEALRLGANSSTAHYDFANALRAAGLGEESFHHYERALQLTPQFPEAHNNWGNALLRAGRLAEAKTHYEAALQLKPDLAEAQTNLGRILFHEGRKAEAIARYETALRLQPNLAGAHQNLANALAQSDRVLEALPHYQRAAELQADNADIYSNWGTALIDADRPAEAIAQLEHALRLRPADAQITERLNEARALARSSSH